MFRPGAALCLVSLFLEAAAAFGARRPDMRVEGHHAFSARHVVSLLALPDARLEWRAGDWQSWAEDAGSLLVDAYRDQGYFEARAAVHLPSADTLEGDFPVKILVRVDEGPRYRFGRVELRISPGAFPAYAVGNLRCRPGRTFDQPLLFRDRRDLLKFYGNAGFLKAQAAESLFYDTAGKTVGVEFHVAPGQALVLDTLLLRLQREGDTSGREGKTRSDLLRGLFPAARGDTLSLKDVSAFERKLKSTRAYNYVRIRDSLEETGGRSALVLNAEERVPGEIDLSGFWENLYGFGGALNWSHGNLGGRLHEGRIGFTFAQRKQSLLLGYASPLLFGTFLRFDNDFVVNWYQDETLVRDLGWFQGNFDVSNQSKLSRQLLPWMRFVSGAELLGSSKKIDSVSRLRDFNLNYLNSLFLHRLDDVVNPSRGARLALTWGNGGPLFRKEKISVFQRRHNWLEAEGAGYFPFGNWLVLALRLDGGRFFSAGGINSERFFLGGPRSVRSQDWRRVRPAIDTSSGCSEECIEPAYVLGSAELRLQPFQPSWISADGKLRHLLGLQFVPFVDYGNVWEVGKTLTPSGRGRAVGVGLRYVFLALFNIRADYAQDPRRSGPSAHRWILDLAQAF